MGPGRDAVPARAAVRGLPHRPQPRQSRRRLTLGISAGEFSARSFGSDPADLQQVRRFVRDVLIKWGLSAYADNAVTVAGELSANALQHALQYQDSGALAWFGLVRRHQAVICTVADPSPCVPTPQHLPVPSETGRGLHIVAALSTAWGCSRPESTGKTVWARIPTATPLEAEGVEMLCPAQTGNIAPQDTEPEDGSLPAQEPAARHDPAWRPDR
ncbi:ATP-binding protein [Streptomyces sp. NPDC004111]|uniref:ATP-binding protein n=1 Tax=Streptomyces sp. NPDC004111 TaxID=3364690 RepID=UPI0036B9FDCF